MGRGALSDAGRLHIAIVAAIGPLHRRDYDHRLGRLAGMDIFRLDGRRALVTGSTRGIGLAIARGLAAAGASIVIHGRSDESLAHAVSALAEDGIAVEAVAFDVADAAAAASAV